MEGDIICFEESEIRKERKIRGTGYKSPEVVDVESPNFYEEDISRGEIMNSRLSPGTSEMDRRREELARARRLNDGLVARYSRRAPSSIQNPIVRQSTVTISPSKSRISPMSSPSKSIVRQSYSLQASTSESSHNRTQQTSFSPSKSSRHLEPSPHKKSCHATNGTAKNSASPRDWKAISQSVNALRKSRSPSSHLVLHISEGMDIKKAIELKKKEAERLQTKNRNDPCLVTLSDSNDEDDEIQVELPDHSNRSKHHNRQNSSNNKHNLNPHKSQGGPSKEDQTNCDSTIETNENNRINNPSPIELDDNDKNKLVNVDDSCEIVETARNNKDKSSVEKKDTKHPDKESDQPKILDKISKPAVKKFTGSGDAASSKIKSFNILDKDNSSSTNVKDTTKSSNSVNNKSVNGEMISKSPIKDKNNKVLAKKKPLVEQKPSSSTNTNIQPSNSSTDCDKPLKPVSLKVDNQIEEKQKNLNKEKQNIGDKNLKADHKKHNDLAEVVSSEKHIENINKSTSCKKLSNKNQLSNNIVNESRSKELSNGDMKTNSDNQNDQSKCANDSIEEVAVTKSADNNQDISKACKVKKNDANVVHINEEPDNKNKKDISNGSKQIVVVENMDENKTKKITTDKNISDENKSTKDKSEKVATKTKCDNIIDEAKTDLSREDSSSIILSETGERNSSPIFLEEVPSETIFSILEKVDEEEKTSDVSDSIRVVDNANTKQKDICSDNTNSLKRKAIEDSPSNKKKRMDRRDSSPEAPSIIFEEQPTTSKLFYPSLTTVNKNELFTKAKPSENIKAGRRITTTLISTNINQKSSNPSKETLAKTDDKKKIVENVTNVSKTDNPKTTKELKDNEIVLNDELDNLDGKECLDLFLKACGSKLPGSEYISVRTKLYKYWNQIPDSSRNSSDLASYIQMKWALVDSDPKNIYIQIRDVMKKCKDLRDEDCTGTSSDAREGSSMASKGQNKNFKSVKHDSGTDSPVPGPSNRNKAQNSATLSEKKPRQVSEAHKLKLQKALRQCAKEIDKLENAEIDFDDEENSVYILQSKYKKRYMEIYKRLAKYDAKPVDLQRQEDKYFKFEDSKFPEINNKITKFVNRNKEFPDFIDIKDLVKECSSKLGWSDSQVHAEAEKIFQAVGKKLVKRRRLDEYDYSCSYVKELVDPATADQNLGAKLQQQVQEGKTKIEKVFQEFVDKQYVSKGRKDHKSDDEGDSNADDIESDEDESVNNESDEEKEEDSVHTCSLLDSDQDMDIIQIDFNENDDDILHLD